MAKLGLALGFGRTTISLDQVRAVLRGLFALFEPRKSVNQIPSHRPLEPRENSPELLADHFRSYVHADQLGTAPFVPQLAKRAEPTPHLNWRRQGTVNQAARRGIKHVAIDFV